MTYKGKMTYEIAMAVGQDAANQQMRKQGRSEWNLDDWNKAAETAQKLLKLVEAQ